MNIYNLQDFKCGICQKWYHPRHALPYLMPCGHSLCTNCLQSKQKIKSKQQSILCPHHSILHSISQIKLNDHIQQALQRLLKNNIQNSVSEVSKINEQLDRMMEGRQKDVKQFIELLDQIYNNEINRLIHLRKRVKQQLIHPSLSIQQWKILVKNNNNQKQVLEQGRLLEKKVRDFVELDLQRMAQAVIANPVMCLQRHFSIYDLVARQQQRKTLKSSVKPNHQRIRSSLLDKSLQYKNNKQNVYINFIKQVQSPVKKQTEMKQLSSFKLQSRLANTIDEQGDTTLRDYQHSKCSFKTKLSHQQKEKRTSSDDLSKNNFADLISSLKSDVELEPLQYSPQVEDELLLSDTKGDINFLKEWEIDRRENNRQMQVRQRQLINCERQKNKYIKKMETVRTQEAHQTTIVSGNTIQLFNFDLREVDLALYLQQFDWTRIQVVKLVGTGLQDSHFNQLLNYLVPTKVHSLLLPNNQLQQISLDALIRYTQMNHYLRTVSFQKNNIHALHGNARAKIAILRKKGVTLYI